MTRTDPDAAAIGNQANAITVQTWKNQHDE